MNPSDLNTWRERQNLASWKAAAEALGVPYWRLLRLKNGKEPIPVDVELASIRCECRHIGQSLENQLGARYEVLCYRWFCERFIKVMELPRYDSRRDELAIILLVGLTALSANGLGVAPVALLNRLFVRVAESSHGEGE
jgi:hypothetical protein